MNCHEAEELLGAYALDALTVEEAEAVRAHLTTCESHAEKAAELRAVASNLALLVDPVAPPATLRGRTLAAIAQTPQTGVAAAPRVLRPSSRLQWRPAAARRIFPSPAWGALAAVLVAAIGGLLAWNLVLLNGDESDAARFATRVTAIEPLTATEGAPGGGFVLYFGDDRRAVLIGEGMPVLDAEHVYQLWSVAGEVPESIGTMEADADGRGTAVVSYDAARATALAVTIEPAGGSDQPTTNPIYVVEL